MWQKVWIVAGAATLNEKPAGETYDHPLPPGVEIRGEDWFGHLSECSMRVMCETDYLALNRRAEESKSGGQGRQFHEKALDIFRETILPALEVEVNEGSHFIPLRQVFWAVSLAKWYRERIAETGLHTRLMELAEESRLTLGPSTEIGPGLGAPQWMNDCYDRYIDLLEGVFRVAEPMESPGRRRVRVYQSGGVLL